MKIVNTNDGRKKFVTRMPCEEGTINEALEGTNRREVIMANDRKLKQLTIEQRKELWEEFSKLVNMKYIKEVDIF